MKGGKQGKNGQSKCRFRHYTVEERRKLLECVRRGMKAKEIGEQLGKDPTSVSRELKRGRHQTGGNRMVRNRCVHVQTCGIKRICRNATCSTLCKNCYYGKKCNELCPDFKEISCAVVERFPYICDGCEKIRGCLLPHYHYDPDKAEAASTYVRTESRRGINMAEEQFAALDEVVTRGTAKGQSIEHIATYAGLPVTSRTVRRYLEEGLLTIKKPDTPRGAVYKPRRVQVTKEHAAQIRRAKEGRDHAAFLRYAQEHPILLYSQMDTVLGKQEDISRARLLTFCFVRINLFYCIKLENGKADSVQRVMYRLWEQLGGEDYRLLFGVILTDNGSEFSHPSEFELVRSTGEVRSQLFYCHPYASWEKGAVEVCHELLRRILPKGTPLDGLTEADVRLINSHINSYTRPDLENRSAYSTFIRVFGERGRSILEKLRISSVPPEEVCLKPSLLWHRADEGGSTDGD